MTAFLYLRHAETAISDRLEWHGNADPPLSPRGKAHALQAARALLALDFGPSTIWTSDCRRAKETAAAFGEVLRCPVVPDANLRERDLSLRFNPGAGREAVWRVAGDVTRPPCDPSDRTEVGHEGDDGGRCWECAPIRAARLPPAAGGAGAPAGLPRRAARLLHPPRGCPGGPGGCAAERPGAGRVAAAAELGAGPSARLGQHLCRAGPRADRRRAAAGAAGPRSLGGWAADLRGGRHHLAALRRRVLP